MDPWERLTVADMTIIDAHCHLGLGHRYRVSREDLLPLMDRCGVEKAVICPVDEYLAVWNREGNDFVLAQAAQSDGRFLAMVTANPWRGAEAVEEVRRGFGEGAVGLKLHPALQGFHITDEMVHRLVELAVECGKPIYFHTGTPVCSEPYQLVELALRYPEAKLIMGHTAFSDFWNDVIAGGRAAPNIWFETSLHWPSFIVEMVEKLGSERILFGSDHPRNAMAVEIEKIERYVKDPSDRDNILWRNARRLFQETGHGA